MPDARSQVVHPSFYLYPLIQRVAQGRRTPRGLRIKSICPRARAPVSCGVHVSRHSGGALRAGNIGPSPPRRFTRMSSGSPGRTAQPDGRVRSQDRGRTYSGTTPGKSNASSIPAILSRMRLVGASRVVEIDVERIARAPFAREHVGIGLEARSVTVVIKN